MVLDKNKINDDYKKHISSTSKKNAKDRINTAMDDEADVFIIAVHGKDIKKCQILSNIIHNCLERDFAYRTIFASCKTGIVELEKKDDELKDIYKQVKAIADKQEGKEHE